MNTQLNQPRPTANSNRLSATRTMTTVAGLLLLWHFTVKLTGVPKFIFPAPFEVLLAIMENRISLFKHALVTLTEIVAGLLIGTCVGLTTALLLVSFRTAQRWLLPLLVLSQAIPVFALAPLLTLWLGYDMLPKIVMASLIIFFPVTAACYDGLRQSSTERIELAQTMGATRWAILKHIRLPSSLPALASGLRVAVAVAPIGAVVGEWVGSSQGLGFLMLHANGRMQTDLMFAALLILCVIAVSLYFLTHRVLDHWITWVPDTAAQR